MVDGHGFRPGRTELLTRERRQFRPWLIFPLFVRFLVRGERRCFREERRGRKVRSRKLFVALKSQK